MSQLIGRGAELAQLLGVLAPDGPRRVHLGATAGMGKTSVWRALVEAAAQAPGTEVLSARPLESEAELGLSGLTDLLASVPEEVYDDLPEPQRVALRAAMLLSDGEESDPRALAAGVRAVLERLARGRTLVLAVDDAHWLDASSASVLSQALARLDDADIRVVVAARPEGRPVDSWLPGAHVLTLPPMETASLFHLVREHTGTTLDRGQLRRLEAASGGNPLHALEVVRARSGGTVHDLVTQRVRHLPRPTRQVLLVTALAATPTVEVVAQAVGASGEEVLARLEPAIQADLAWVSGERIRFAHPLHLDAAIWVAADLEVRAARTALAEVEPRPEVAVRHRALVVAGPDSALAADLAAAATLMHGRGAWDEACDLQELAVARTPPGEPEGHVRMLRLGEWLHRAGRPAEAEEWLRAAAASPDPLIAARATMQLCQALIYVGRRDETHEMIRGLLAADLPPLLSCEVRYRLGRDLRPEQLDESYEAMTQINEELDRLPAQPGLAALRAETLSEEARLRTFTGHAEGDLLERALQLEWEEPPAFLLRSAALGSAQSASQRGDFEQSREEFDALIGLCHDRGDEFSLPVVTFLGAYLDLRAGHWQRARQVAADAAPVADGQGQVYGWLLRLIERFVAGLQGDVEASLDWLLRAGDHRGPEGAVPFEGNRLTAAAHLLLMLRRPDEAWPLARQAREAVHAIGWRDPEGQAMDREYVEAALLTGRTDLARAALTDLRQVATRMENRRITLTTCQRLEVQLLAAEGDLAGAAALVPAMVAAHDEGPCEPLQRGLALLVAGEVLRRVRRRKDARLHLERALAQFEALGAGPYADRARGDLARLGLRTTSEIPALTPNEERVARLAAEGLRNREIAEKLFVGVKTVESVLTTVYRKLGVRSRTGLARALTEAAG